MSEEELNELRAVRQQKLQELVSSGENPFKSSFQRTHLISAIVEKHQDIQPGETTGERVTIAGRLMAKREHGKASFMVIKDGSASLQLYLTIDKLGESEYQRFLQFDIGDFIGVSGFVFRTRRGELSAEVEEYELLTKSLRPLPEKWHGLTDVETRFRQRYLDLMMNPEVKETFEVRSRVIKAIRELLDGEGFLEVETPMLQSIPGGATARPFITHHQALDIDLYLRIAPELYLKRLIIGGMERVYEINRNFRNEGMSIKHNPEFTMLELYQAYADYHDMMDLTERVIKHVLQSVRGSSILNYQGKEYDFSVGWKRLTLLEAIKQFAGLDVSFKLDMGELKKIAGSRGIQVEKHWGKGKLIFELFEKLVEPEIVQPTFVLDYPLEISPLARKHPQDPELTERFELIVGGREIANAFSELTDPIDQRQRFEAQVAAMEAGDEEAQRLDEDFLRALEYGMPPTGGLGIGIDRLVMLLTDAYSIREVLLFPQMRPEK